MERNRKHFCQLENNSEHIKGAPNLSLGKKILRQFRNISTITEQYPLTKYYFRSTKAISDERKKHINSHAWYTIHPFSKLHYVRQFIMTFVYVYVVFFDLFKATFLIGIKCKVIQGNVLCFIDLCLNFITGYITKIAKTNVHYTSGIYQTEETTTVLEPKKIAKQYICTYFFIDFICVINLLSIIFMDFFEEISVIYALIFIRILRLIRFKTVCQNVKMLISNLRYEEDVHIIFICVFWFIFVVYLYGCLLYLVPNMASHYLGEERHMFVTTVEDMYMYSEQQFTLFKLFVHSLYEAMSLLISGESVELAYNIENYILTILILFSGIFLKVMVFLTIFAVINRRYQSRLKYLSFILEVKDFIRNQKFNKKLSNDVLGYFEETLKKEYFNEATILNTLQRQMQYEIFSQISMDLIRNCHLFRNLPNYFIVQLSLRLIYETFIPGVKVVKIGEIATCMYFIANGTVAIYSEDHKEICHLSDGDYFGEIGLIQSTLRVADVITIEHCAMYRLDIKDFQEVIKPNSVFYRRITKSALKRMNTKIFSDI